MQNNTDLVPFPSVDITTLTQQQLDALLLENEQLKQATNSFITDIKLVKKAMFDVADKIGLQLDKTNEDSEFDYGKLMSFVSKIALMGTKKRAKEFEFLTSIFPHFAKYKDV